MVRMVSTDSLMERVLPFSGTGMMARRETKVQGRARGGRTL